MKILLVEDDRDLSKALKEVLVLSNYEVDIASQGQEALHYLKIYNYDVIVMDIMMPIMDGISTTKAIRANGNNTPIIMLTAKSELDDKIEGLDSGADDYLTKPFQAKELLARLRALSRRNTNIFNVSTYGNVSLNEGDCSMNNGDKSSKLTRKELQLLDYLFKNKETFIRSEKILDDVWDSDTDAYITVVWVFISNLRKKLKDIDADIEIEASRGNGYRIIKK